MATFINEQNRIDGTRVTVWDVYVYSREGVARDVIAFRNNITEEQVQVALDHIAANLEYVEQVHQQIEERNARGNSPEVRARLEALQPVLEAKKKEIRERAAKRKARTDASSHPGGSQNDEAALFYIVSLVP
ncbi:hypothetical protein BH11PLA2_BH11PLA2_37840 [soil metagenome]